MRSYCSSSSPVWWRRLAALHQRGHFGLFVLLFALDDVDAHLVEHRHRVFDLFGRDLVGRQDLVQFVIGDVAALLGARDHLAHADIGHVEQRAIGVRLGPSRSRPVPCAGLRLRSRLFRRLLGAARGLRRRRVFGAAFRFGVSPFGLAFVSVSWQAAAFRGRLRPWQPCGRLGQRLLLHAAAFGRLGGSLPQALEAAAFAAQAWRGLALAAGCFLPAWLCCRFLVQLGVGRHTASSLMSPRAMRGVSSGSRLSDRGPALLAGLSGAQ